jgi:hypothetical protein
LAPQKRGPKPHRDPVADENQQLRREVERLTEDLRKADIVIDVQKKTAMSGCTPTGMKMAGLGTTPRSAFKARQ